MKPRGRLKRRMSSSLLLFFMCICSLAHVATSQCAAGHACISPACTSCEACVAGTYSDGRCFNKDKDVFAWDGICAWLENGGDDGDADVSQVCLMLIGEGYGYGFGYDGDPLDAMPPDMCCICMEAFPFEEECTACPAGSFSDMEGASSCSQCEAGKYSLAGASVCTNCVAGKYSLHTEAAKDSSTWTGVHGSCSAYVHGATYHPWCVVDGACSQCPVACQFKCGLAQKFAGASSCEDCAAGTYSATGASTCLPGCPAGQTGPDAQSCVSCAAGKYKPASGSAACTDCPSNSLSVQGSTALTNCLCNVGYTGPNGGTCSACDWDTYKGATGSAACTACPAYSVTSATAQTAISSCLCKYGYTGPNGGTCSACPLHTYKSGSGSAACTACPANSVTTATAQGQSSSCRCNLGYTGPNGGPCTGCALSTYKGTTGSALCTACPANAVTLATNNAALGACLCNLGYTYSPSNGGTCAECFAGKYKANLGSAACTDCLAGTYSPTVGATTSSMCTSCGAGKYSNTVGATTASTCISCGAGKYNAVAGPKLPVVEFSYQGGITTLMFDANYTVLDAPEDSFAIGAQYLSVQTIYGFPGMLSFPAGTQLQLDWKSQEPEGCHEWGRSLVGKIALVARGTCGFFFKMEHATNAGAVAIIIYNNVSPLVRRAGVDKGVATSVAWYIPVAAISKAHGEFLAMQVQQSGVQMTVPFVYPADCTDCTAGTYSPTVGATTASTCISCGADTYSTSVGATVASTCINCAAGQISPAGSDAPEDCISPGCPAGQTGSDALNCVSCEAGKYKETVSFDACTACPVNSVTLATGQTALSQCVCNRGHTGPDGGTCTACEAGSYKATTGALPCTFCAENTFSTTVAAVSADCAACPANSVSVAGSGSIDLCFCNAGYNQTAAHDACVECLPGFYDNALDRYECSKCPGGLYSAARGATGVETCTACQAGTWSETGSATCQPCPARSNSSEASAFLSDCKCNPGSTGEDGQTCVSCPAGKYKPGSGSAACTDCGAGTYSTATGATLVSTCIRCSPDTFQAAPGQSACGTCADNEMPATSTCVAHNPTSQVLCPAGYTANRLSPGTCTACPAGKYKDFIGSFPGTENDLLLSGVRNLTFLDGRWMYIGQHVSKPMYMHSSGDFNLKWANFFWEIRSLTSGMQVVAGGSSQSFPNNSASIWYEIIFGFPDIESTYFKFTMYSDCTNCPAGTFSTSTGATSIAACTGVCPIHSTSVTGATASTQHCQCNFGYSGPNGGPCTACVAGRYKSRWGSASCDQCSLGKYSTDTGVILERSCTPCPAGKMAHTGGGATACIDCVAGKFQSATTSTVCSNCAAGKFSDTGYTVCCASSPHCGNDQYMLSGTCQSCPAEATAPACSTALTACQCKPGYAGPNGGPCTACTPGKSKSAPGCGNTGCTCFPCGVGKYQDTSTATVCKSCPVSKYTSLFTATSVDSCASCPANSSSPILSSRINDCVCSAGYTGLSTTQCTACNASTYKPSAGSQMCSACPAASSAIPGTGNALTACLCNAGYYGPPGGPCSLCPSGTYKPDRGSGLCTACPVELFSPAGSDALEDCGVCRGSTSCTCNLGFIRPDGGTCTACEAGQYSATMGGSTCSNCGAGTYSTTVGATTASTCISCGAGTYSGAGASICTSCGAGTYSGAGASICTSCGAGTYSPTVVATTASTCISCGAGTYSPTVGATTASACIGCDAGKYSATTGATAASTCIDCTCGKFTSSSGRSVCTSCTYGNYQTSAGQTTCTLCPQDTFGQDNAQCGACTTCPVNSGHDSTGLSGILSCQCNVGYHGYAGTWSAGGGPGQGAPLANNECQVCVAGKYKTVRGSAACVDCAAGQYSTTVGATTLATCQTCPTNTYSGDGLSACVACPAASQSPSGSPALSSCLCNAGFETAWNGELLSCTACATGKYKAAPGSESACTLCDTALPHSTSALDSGSASCVCRAGFFLDAGACSACKRGTYKELQGNTTVGCATLEQGCCACAAFETTASEASISALGDCLCIHGHGVLEPSDFACVPCPRGTY